MLYNREKILLALIEQIGKPITSVKLQKLLFLLCDITEDRFYDFMPYKYGCYSMQASQDIKRLISLGIIINDGDGMNKKVRLANYDGSMRKLICYDNQLHIEKVCNRFGNMSTDEIITYTYQHYPFFAINSLVADRYLESRDISRIKAIRPSKPNIELMTIGYEGITLEQYIVKLIQNDVRVLCDVRKNAYSQKFGFSKAILSKACEGAMISYVHIPSLGIVSDKRRNLNSQDDYDKLFEEYDNTVLMTERNSLNAIYLMIQRNRRVALTCFEHDPKQCHRSRIANRLMSIPQCNYSLKHL